MLSESISSTWIFVIKQYCYDLRRITKSQSKQIWREESSGSDVMPCISSCSKMFQLLQDKEDIFFFTPHKASLCFFVYLFVFVFSGKGVLEASIAFIRVKRILQSSAVFALTIFVFYFSKSSHSFNPNFGLWPSHFYGFFFCRFSLFISLLW